MTTLGLSPKAILAFFYPFIATFGGVVASWITSGTFNGAELKIAAAGLIASGLALLGAYAGHPGQVAKVSDPAVIPPDEGDAGAPKPKRKGKS